MTLNLNKPHGDSFWWDPNPLISVAVKMMEAGTKGVLGPIWQSKVEQLAQGHTAYY